MTDEDRTVIERVIPSKRSRGDYRGEERRAPPEPDYLKLLPIAVLAVSGVAAFVTVQVKQSHLEQEITRLEREHDEDRAEQKSLDAAQWGRIAGLMEKAGVPFVPGALP